MAVTIGLEGSRKSQSHATIVVVVIIIHCRWCQRQRSVTRFLYCGCHVRSYRLQWTVWGCNKEKLLNKQKNPYVKWGWEGITFYRKDFKWNFLSWQSSAALPHPAYFSLTHPSIKSFVDNHARTHISRHSLPTKQTHTHNYFREDCKKSVIKIESLDSQSKQGTWSHPPILSTTSPSLPTTEIRIFELAWQPEIFTTHPENFQLKNEKKKNYFRKLQSAQALITPTSLAPPGVQSRKGR